MLIERADGRSRSALIDDLAVALDRFEGVELDYEAVRVALQDAPGLARTRLSSGTRFVLDDDFTIEEDLSAFLEAVPLGAAPDGRISGRTSQSEHTWDALAFDLVQLVEYGRDSLHRTLSDMTYDDLLSYKAARVMPPSEFEIAPVTPRTWNRQLASINRYLRFRAGDPNFNGPTVFGQPLELFEPVGPSPALQYRSIHDSLRWIQMGLGGQGVNGGLLPRNATRDEALARLMAGAGLRVGETALLLLPEIWEEDPTGIVSSKVRSKVSLSSKITKGGRPRTFRVFGALSRLIRNYIEKSRPGYMKNVADDGSWIFCTVDHHAGKIVFDDGRSLPYADIGRKLRPLLAERGSDGSPRPLALWLTATGSAFTADGVYSAFRRSNERCAQAGYEMVIHPHTLRHTFAVHRLAGLLVEQGLIDRRTGQLTVDENEIKGRLDVIAQVQREMGHSSYATTIEAYLRPVIEDPAGTIESLIKYHDAVGAQEIVNENA
ncbi:tyrosine-type recombinase/integrase [Curtobacterium sp. VKM Ac-1393]|uniref:tyrosine-type recombinase/integrase n=1 Tax=Curtobacterium sp. VKM Ac-1393 TaxID=2783814 RepID=UPI00188D2AAC|nr:site-specific integrase [Curtobacterium sp. VKM Ac-1393]MBF4608923.1 site-specific integrase [Curtobacterium sp. VKM Ac-1393]